MLRNIWLRENAAKHLVGRKCRKTHGLGENAAKHMDWYACRVCLSPGLMCPGRSACPAAVGCGPPEY